MIFSRCTQISLFSIINTQVRGLSNKSAIFSRPHRLVYPRMYPTLLVFPDGSTITVRHPEPRKIIRLPLNLAELSENERKERLEKRRPKKKLVIQEDIDDGFDSRKYVKIMKK